VDEEIGDRLSNCGGVMAPQAIESHSKKGMQILHKCRQCGFERKNILALDDDIDMITQIMRNSAY